VAEIIILCIPPARGTSHNYQTARSYLLVEFRKAGPKRGDGLDAYLSSITDSNIVLNYTVLCWLKTCSAFNDVGFTNFLQYTSESKIKGTLGLCLMKCPVISLLGNASRREFFTTDTASSIQGPPLTSDGTYSLLPAPTTVLSVHYSLCSHLRGIPLVTDGPPRRDNQQSLTRP
jgi:hypothetical protein